MDNKIEKTSSNTTTKRPKRSATKRPETFGYYSWHACRRTESCDALIRWKNSICGLHFCVPCIKNKEPKLSTKEVLDRKPEAWFVWKSIWDCKACLYYKKEGKYGDLVLDEYTMLNYGDYADDEFLNNYMPPKRTTRGRRPLTRQQRRKTWNKSESYDHTLSCYGTKENNIEDDSKRNMVNYDDSQISNANEEDKYEEEQSDIQTPKLTEGIRKVFTYERDYNRRRNLNKDIPKENQSDDKESCFEDADEDLEDNSIIHCRQERVCKIDDFIIITKYQERFGRDYINSSDDEDEPQHFKFATQNNMDKNIIADSSRKRDIKMLQKEKLKYKEEKANFNISSNFINTYPQTQSAPIPVARNVVNEHKPIMANNIKFGDGNNLQMQTHSQWKLPDINKVITMPTNDMTNTSISTDGPINNHFNPFK